LCCAFCTPPPPPSVCCCNFFSIPPSFPSGFQKEVEEFYPPGRLGPDRAHITQPPHPPSRRLECLSLDEKGKKEEFLKRG
jgi:hypothetical protein